MNYKRACLYALTYLIRILYFCSFSPYTRFEYTDQFANVAVIKAHTYTRTIYREKKREILVYVCVCVWIQPRGSMSVIVDCFSNWSIMIIVIRIHWYLHAFILYRSSTRFDQAMLCFIMSADTISSYPIFFVIADCLIFPSVCFFFHWYFRNLCRWIGLFV